MILVQIPADNRIVVRDPVSKLSQAIKSSLQFPAGVAGEHPV